MDYTLLALIAVLPLVLVGQVYLLGRKMSEPEKMMRPIEEGLSPYQQKTLLAQKDWLTSVNLQYRTSFKFGIIQAVVFQQGNESRFFSFMFHQRLTF